MSDGTWTPEPVTPPVIGIFDTPYADALAAVPAPSAPATTAFPPPPPAWTPPPPPPPAPVYRSWSSTATSAPEPYNDPRLTVRGLCIIVVIALLCGGGSFAIGDGFGTGLDRTARLGRAMKQTTTVPVTLASTPPSLSGDALELQMLLVKAPAGSRKYSVPNSAGGVRGIDDFVAANYQDPFFGKFSAQSLNFQIAVASDWLGPDGVQVETQLAEFDNTADAVSFVTDADHDETIRDTTVKERFTVRGAPDCWLYHQPALDKVGNRRAMIYCDAGQVAITMFFFCPGSYDQAAETAVLQRQLDALSA